MPAWRDLTPAIAEQPGDVTKEPNRHPVTSVSQFRSALGTRRERGISLYLVRRGDDTVDVAVPEP